MKKVISMILAVVLLMTIIPANIAFAAQASPENGTYFITQGSKAVNVYSNYVSGISNNVKINMYSVTQHETQMFSLEKQSNGSYKILTQKSGYTFNLTSLKSGGSTICFKDTTKNTEYFIIEPVGSGYVIKPKKASTLAVTVSGSDLVLQKYTGSSKQIFNFKKVNLTEAVDIKLDVPVMRQTSSKWGNYEFAPGVKIKDYGCLVTSIAAALSCVDGTKYTPDVMAGKLKFTQTGDSKGALHWTYGPAKRFNSNENYSLYAIKFQLEKGNPVLVKGAISKTTHWVVVTGVKNAEGSKLSPSDFTVMDPSFKDNVTLKDFFNDFPNSKRLAVLK